MPETPTEYRTALALTREYNAWRQERWEAEGRRNGGVQAAAERLWRVSQMVMSSDIPVLWPWSARLDEGR